MSSRDRRDRERKLFGQQNKRTNLAKTTTTTSQIGATSETKDPKTSKKETIETNRTETEETIVTANPQRKQTGKRIQNHTMKEETISKSPRIRTKVTNSGSKRTEPTTEINAPQMLIMVIEAMNQPGITTSKTTDLRNSLLSQALFQTQGRAITSLRSPSSSITRKTIKKGSMLKSKTRTSFPRLKVSKLTPILVTTMEAQHMETIPDQITLSTAEKTVTFSREGRMTTASATRRKTLRRAIEKISLVRLKRNGTAKEERKATTNYRI